MSNQHNIELVPAIFFELAQENKLPVNKWLATRIKNICLKVIGYYFRTISNTAITEYLQSDYFKLVYTDINSLTDYKDYILNLLSNFNYQFSINYGSIRTAVSTELKELLTDLEERLSPIEYTVFMSSYVKKCQRYHWHW